MECNKVIFMLAFATALILVSNVAPSTGWESNRAKNISHNFILGSRISGDRLALRKTVYKPSKIYQIISHLETFNVSRFYRITQVAAYDQKIDGTGAFVSYIRGGPGYQNVTLHFTSQRNHGIRFIIDVYAR